MKDLIKICGLMNIEDSLFCLENGAGALGFVAYSGSPRFILPEIVASIISVCKISFPDIRYVGVFVNSELGLLKEYIAAGINTIQIHSHRSLNHHFMNLPEIPEEIKIWLSYNSHTERPIFIDGLEAVHYDSFDPRAIGGTGRLSDWAQARQIRDSINLPLILAGGLTHLNIANAIKAVHPSGVDVSSGVELFRGVKDHDKIRKFISEALAAYEILKISDKKSND